jgi:hypothetical protein
MSRCEKSELGLRRLSQQKPQIFISAGLNPYPSSELCACVPLIAEARRSTETGRSETYRNRCR